MSREVFLVCHRSFANVIKLIVWDSTGHDNSRASTTWHGVHILVGSPKIHMSFAICQVQNNYLKTFFFFWLTQISHSNLALLFEMLNLISQSCYKHTLRSKTLILTSLARWKSCFQRWGDSSSLNRLWSGFKKLYLIIKCLSKFL